MGGKQTFGWTARTSACGGKRPGRFRPAVSDMLRCPSGAHEFQQCVDSLRVAWVVNCWAPALKCHLAIEKARENMDQPS